MYADTITKSMRRAIDETNRRRKIQDQYNKKHGIIPRTINKEVRDVIEATIALEEEEKYMEEVFTAEELEATIEVLRDAMLREAEELNFEKAAELRDRMIQLKKMQDAGLQ